MTGIPDALPQLAIGAHSRGSGKACIMNAISYLNGDQVITDMPDCADVMLALVAIRTNDMICTHRFGKRFVEEDPGFEPLLWEPAETTSGALLCPLCSARMWALGSRIIGTSAVWTQDPSLDRAVIQERLAWEFLTRTFDWFASDFRLGRDRRDLMQEMQRVLVYLGRYVENPELLRDPAHAHRLNTATTMLTLAPYASLSNKRDEMLVHGVYRLGGAMLYRVPARHWGSPRNRNLMAIEFSKEAIKAAFIGIGGPEIHRRAVEFVDRWYALTGWNTVRDFTVEDIAKVRTEARLIPA